VFILLHLQIILEHSYNSTVCWCNGFWTEVKVTCMFQGNVLTISPTMKVFTSHNENTVNIPTHQVGSFKYRYCTHRILGYTLRYLGGRGRGHLQLHNKWQSEWSYCSLQTMILCSTLQHSTNHYCLNTTVETDKNTCLYIELIKTFPQTLIFRYLQTNTFLILSNWILKCSVNNLQWINTGNQTF